VADQSWKAGTADSNDTALGCTFSPSGACFTDRKLAAVRAYHEWMPVRQVAADDKLRIWRNFQIGKLLDLTMLDTRQYDRDITDVGFFHTAVVCHLLMEFKLYYNTDCKDGKAAPNDCLLIFNPDISSISDFANRSLMGIPQENCGFRTIHKLHFSQILYYRVLRDTHRVKIPRSNLARSRVGVLLYINRFVPPTFRLGSK